MKDIFTPEALETLRIMAFNAVWITGAAIDLAVISYVIYELRLGNGPLADLLDEPAYARWLLIGTILTMVGAALTESTLWRTILYGIMALALLIRLIAEIRNKEPRNDSSE